MQLQNEVGGLKLIAGECRCSGFQTHLLMPADYERHLLEPSRKVREDVEKEYLAKVSKLETQLESKKIWANRLDENVRALSVENREYQAVRILFYT
jgi:centromeric protein E